MRASSGARRSPAASGERRLQQLVAAERVGAGGEQARLEQRGDDRQPDQLVFGLRLVDRAVGGDLAHQRLVDGAVDHLAEVGVGGQLVQVPVGDAEFAGDEAQDGHQLGKLPQQLDPGAPRGGAPLGRGFERFFDAVEPMRGLDGLPECLFVLAGQEGVLADVGEVLAHQVLGVEQRGAARADRPGAAVGVFGEVPIDRAEACFIGPGGRGRGGGGRRRVRGWGRALRRRPPRRRGRRIRFGWRRS